MVTILEGHEALSDLEEVGVRFVRCEVDIESECAVGANLLLGWRNLEGVFHDCVRGLVVDWKEGPVD